MIVDGSSLWSHTPPVFSKREGRGREEEEDGEEEEGRGEKSSGRATFVSI